VKKGERERREKWENRGMGNSEGRHALQDCSEQLPSLLALLLSPLSWQWLHTPATSSHRATLVALLPQLTPPGGRGNSISSSPPPNPPSEYIIIFSLLPVAYIPLLMK